MNSDQDFVNPQKTADPVKHPYSYAYSKILDIGGCLYVGNRLCSSQSESHGLMGDEAPAIVLNCTPNLSFPFHNPDQIWYRFNVQDNGSEAQAINLFQLIQESRAFEQMANALQDKKNVLIYCAAGQQRSCAVCACFIMYMCHKVWHRPYTIDGIVAAIRSMRPEAFFVNVNFALTLDMYRQSLM